MNAATGPRDARVLVATGARLADATWDAVPDLVGDALVVVNDAATLPASLQATLRGLPVELRLAAAEPWRAVVFGAGDWRMRTEDRPAPPRVAVGDRLEGVGATVVAVEHPRLVTLRFDLDGDALWRALYRLGRPVQYSYAAADLPLWAVQTPYAGRPWAMEMPSAGRAIPWRVLQRLRVATLTHAAGLSSTGDAEVDAMLPLPERYDLPAATVDAIRSAPRVIAVGTSVVRALEGNHAAHGRLVAGEGITDLRLGDGFRPRVVDALVTGVHEPGTSHWELLRAFADPGRLREIRERAEAWGYLGHEFGDVVVLCTSPR